MIPVVATEETFVREALIKHGSSPTHFMQFMLLHDELVNLLTQMTNPASTEAQVLAGLLNARKLSSVQRSDMKKNLNTSLSELKSEYIELSLMCGKNFVHWPPLCSQDAAEFLRFGISTHHANSIRYDEIVNRHKTNVISSWSLVDGGVSKMSDHVAEHLNYISEIKIYDRYFGMSSLASLTDLFSSYSPLFGPFPGRINIYVGRGLLDGLNTQHIQNTLAAHIDVNGLTISTSNKIAPAQTQAHDRLLQLDNDSTFEFTAGLGCYVENGGKNRASTVLHRSILRDYSEFQIKDDQGKVVRFRY